MKVSVGRLAIPDVLLILPHRFSDDRGCFEVTYQAAEYRNLGVPDMVQDNQARSIRRGTIRGLHFQHPPHEQAKLVRVLAGEIFDLAVDLRQGSATFGKWASARLTSAGGEQVFVPRGFAHGYCTLSDDTIVAYKCDAYYAPDDQGGILFSDPDLGIPWPADIASAIVSERDRALPRLRDIHSPFGLGAR